MRKDRGIEALGFDDNHGKDDAKEGGNHGGVRHAVGEMRQSEEDRGREDRCFRPDKSGDLIQQEPSEEDLLADRLDRDKDEQCWWGEELKQCRDVAEVLRVCAAEPDDEKVDDDGHDKCEKHREHAPHERPVESFCSELYPLQHLFHIESVDQEVPEEGDAEEDADHDNQELDDEREDFNVDLHGGRYSADL